MIPHWPTNPHSTSTGWSLSLHPFSSPILFLTKLLGRFLWASAILQRSAIATRHDLLTCPKAAANSRGKAFSELTAKQAAATALNESSFFIIIIVVSWTLLRINWPDNRAKTAWSHTDFLENYQFKADRNTSLLRSSPKLDLWLTSAFSKDDVKQGTKARNR